MAVGMGAEAQPGHPGPLSLSLPCPTLSLPEAHLHSCCLLAARWLLHLQKPKLYLKWGVGSKGLVSDNGSLSYKQRKDFLKRPPAGFPFKHHWPDQNQMSTPRGGQEDGYLAKRNAIA